MQITNIRFDKLEPKDSGVCAEATIFLDNILCIHKVSVVNGKKGLFIAFPNTGNMKRYKNAKRYFDIVHPIDKSLRQYIENEVIFKYKKASKDLA